jgi:hypothetical protein
MRHFHIALLFLKEEFAQHQWQHKAQQRQLDSLTSRVQ